MNLKLPLVCCMVLLGGAILSCFSARPLAAAEADREVAIWAVDMGGFVVLEGDRRRIRDVADLPVKDFRIEVLNLVGANIHPPHLEAVGKLTALKELDLPGPMWNPRAESKTDYYESAGYLAGLPSLKKLTFSLSFLISIHFDDRGLDKLQSLGPTLEELVIRRALVKGPGLRHFTNLRALDITWSYVEDAEMGGIAGMTKLRKFWAADTRIGEKTLKILGNLRDLEDVDIGGTSVTEKGLASLAGLTHLKKLNLLGADITDAGIDSLAGMKDLESLNLYRTKVSNAGLEKLKPLTNLREVDLRYTRATEAGVENLRAALPNAQLVFLDYSPKPAGGKSATIVAGKGDQAVADWVKSIGGKAVMENGALVEALLNGASVSDEGLKNIEGLTRLRKITLDGTEVGDLGIGRLAGLSGLTELSLNSTGVSDARLEHIGRLMGLRKLHLNNTLIEGGGLAHLKNLKSLEELSLLGSPIKDNGLTVLPELSSLKRLSLATTDITDEGMKYLSGLTGLERLDLSSTDIDDKGIEQLKGLTGLTELILDYSGRFSDAGFAHLAGLKNLVRLSLLRTRVTDKSMKVIAGFTALENLDLNYTGVTDKGLVDLAALKNLKSLGLDSTFVTDKSGEILLGFKKLEQLNLYHTVVSNKAHEELKSGLAGCRITWDEKSAMPNRRRS